MGLFPAGLLRPRETRQRLPLYQQTRSPASFKEHYSESEFSSDDDDDGNISDGFYSASLASPQSASGRSSRQSSGSAATSSFMLPKRVGAVAANTFNRLPKHNRRSAGAFRRHLYRLPNKVIRYLCGTMILTILLLILTLARASMLENQRLASGNYSRPKPAPPAWESFDFLTRYYGGVRTIVPLQDNIFEYPREEDEQPYNATTADAAAADHTLAPPKGHLHGVGVNAASNKNTLPISAPFEQHPVSVFAEGVAAGHGSGIAPMPCYIDEKSTIRVPSIRYYNGRPAGFPRNVFGSYDELSLPEDVCFERYGRFGPYGYGYSVRSGGLGIGEYGEKDGSESVWESSHPIDYSSVDWAEIQRRCYNSNSHRFKTTTSRAPNVQGFYVGDASAGKVSGKSDGASSLTARNEKSAHTATVLAHGTAPSTIPDEPKSLSGPTSEKAPSDKVESAIGDLPDTPRTAVVIRCWDTFEWREEDIMNLRALITELSLSSSARYDIHLLIQVKDDAKYPIWADADTYQMRIKESVPAEFRGLVTLWTETQMLALYQGIHDLFSRGPDLPVHGVYRGLQMAMQYFAQMHPEYEYFWQWEMDIRYTSHNLDLFTKMEDWALRQPRKGLWERNARFYMPDVHGSWDDFRQMARVQTEVGTTGADNIWDSIAGKDKKKGKEMAGEPTVWGPLRSDDPNDWFEPENDPQPPTSYEKDRYVWGVGEEADLITLNPIFDPQDTTWLLADDITGYNTTGSDSRIPRRAQIITASRMSRRLLRTMHLETAFRKHHAFPEMWPATAALQHGYKAVYVPHPVYVDREWPLQYMARTFNGGRNGASGGSRTSVFGQREHNFQGLSWYYNAGFSPNLYRRWLGLKINNDGGQEFEETMDPNKDGQTVPTMRGGEGRMCLPAMLLHPIKGVELPVESVKEDQSAATPESDPSA